MNQLFWKNKKVFLTGHTGFKGSWLSLWLHELGAKVMGYALKPNTSLSLFELADVKKTLIHVEADITDYALLRKQLVEFQPDIILHLAAQALVKESYKDPVMTFNTNVMGTVNLLDAARFCDSVKVILNVTSDKCYENKEKNISYDEQDPMGGYDPYSSSKGCSELVTAAYRRSFFPSIAVATARAGNVIGGGDWAVDRLVPDLVRAIASNNPLLLRYPNAIRPWQHVLEPLRGYLTLIEKAWHDPQNYSQAWNFGPRESDHKTVQWFVESFLKEWSSDIGYHVEKNRTDHEAAILKLDISKAVKMLKWRPTLTLDQAVQWTVDWYKHSHDLTNVRDIVVNQIHNYQEITV
ncbi:MAG: CDP-glucose 4,6-dehydratase [Gammaproteobacteria bacterium]|nr:CDP-glucose 4,6-dehydratase [Gammaproteobacteria bacterium]